MMRKYLMSGLAAVALGGLLSGCNNVDDLNESIDSTELSIIQNYENAFTTRFGQPAESQTWGFGKASAGTRYGNPGEDVPYTSEAINANANEWADKTPGKTYGGWIVPDPLTDDQKAIVRAYFQANPNLSNEDPRWRHFFVQQVYKGHDNPPTTGNHEVTTAANGTSTYTSDNMNKLTVGHDEQHLNDFNDGDRSWKGVLDKDYTANDYDKHHHSDQISLMVNIDDTSCFGYHNSGCSIQRNDKWALVGWETIRTWARNNGIYKEDILNDKWNRSFIGFDFELLKKEDSYYKDNSGNPIYAKFSNGQLNNLQYVYYGPNDIRKRGTTANTRNAKRARTRGGETSVDISNETVQIKYFTPQSFSLSDEAKELLVAGNYLGVDLSVVPEWYNNQWNYGTYTNWGIKIYGHWGEENGGRLDNGSFTLSANSTNVEMQLSESDVAILKQQTLTIYPTADPVDISRIYISNYSQANGGGSSSGTESGESQGGESQGGESQGGESQGGESQGGESQSDDNYEIYDSEYLIVNDKQIPFLIENKNMYSGVKYLNGDEMLTDADMTITVNGKQCFNMAKIKELVDDGYLPVWNSNLRTWVKWAGGDGYFSDWIVTLTEAKKITETPPTPPDTPDGFVCRIIAEDLTVGENSDFDFNDVVFDVFQNGNLIIRAIGGELPLYIGTGSVEDATEVHLACIGTLPGYTNKGKDSHLYMRNTGWSSSGNKENVAIDYNANLGTIELGGTYNSRTDAKGIKIWVKKSFGFVELKADQGKVASKVCVGSDYKWCSEREDIDRKFRDKNSLKLFQQYVIGKLGDDWNARTAWYQYKGKVAVLLE